MCTYEDLVDATLAARADPARRAAAAHHHPRRVRSPGSGIESASWRNGLPHESVLEMDVLTGDGRGRHDGCRVAPPRPVPRLPQLLRHPRLRHPAAHRARAGRRAVVACATCASTTSTSSSPRSGRSSPTGTFDGEPVDYVDGVVFSATESYLVLGRRSDEPGPTSDYTGRDIYYRSIQHDGPRAAARPADDPRLPVALGHRLVLVLAGVRGPEPAGAPVLAAAAGCAAASTGSSSPSTGASTSPTGSRPARAGRRASGWCRTSRSRWRRTAEFLRWFLREVPIEPIWLCPLRLRSDAAVVPLPAAPRRDLRQRRLLVVRARRPRRRRRRHEPAHRARGHRPRRPQVAVLRVVLRRGGVPPALRRRRSTPRSSSGGTPTGGCPTSTPRRSAAPDRAATTTDPTRQRRGADVHRRDRRVGRRRPAAAAPRRLRRVRARAARRPARPAPAHAARRGLPRHRTR